MSDRRVDEATYLRAPHNRPQLSRILWPRLGAAGLIVSGAAVMAIATVDAPASPSAPLRLSGDQTPVPLPIGTGCVVTTVPALLTTVSVPTIPGITSCSSTRTTSQASSSADAGMVITSSALSTLQPGTSAVTAPLSITSAPPLSSSTSSTKASKTAAGVLGADAGTPSTGTDIAFGIGIGLMIAGAGIGAGTGAFLKRRRTID